MIQSVEVEFRYGGHTCKARAARDGDGTLSLGILSDDGYNSWGKNVRFEPEEAEAICAAMNGLGCGIPAIIHPPTETMASLQAAYRSED